MIVENVMKVIDIHVRQADTLTIQWFLDSDTLAYVDEDSTLNEHLFSLYIDPDELEKAPLIVRTEVQELLRLAGDSDASYVRFIK